MVLHVCLDIRHHRFDLHKQGRWLCHVGCFISCLIVETHRVMSNIQYMLLLVRGRINITGFIYERQSFNLFTHRVSLRLNQLRPLCFVCVKPERHFEPLVAPDVFGLFRFPISLTHSRAVQRRSVRSCDSSFQQLGREHTRTRTRTHIYTQIDTIMMSCNKSCTDSKAFGILFQ